MARTCRSGMSAKWPLLEVIRTLSRQHPRAEFDPIADINSGSLGKSAAEGVATGSFPCGIGHSGRLSPRSRKRGRPTLCRAGISDRYIQRLPGRSHTADRHRHTSCDETPEKFPALERRKPGTPIDSVQSASCSTPRDGHSLMFSEVRTDGPPRRRRGRKGRCSACERRPKSSAAAARVRAKADARDLRRGAATR
jgi:hypothetical protein